MVKFSKVALAGLLLATPVFQVFAQANDSNPVPQNLTNAIKPSGDPTTVCPVNGLCAFYNLKSWQGDPEKDGAYYYCVPPDNATSFKMENHAVLITGFDENGKLSSPISILKTYAFGAYLDPHSQLFPIVRIKDQDNNPIACYPGKGNRKVFPKPPGLY